MLTNFSVEELTIYKATVLGVAEEVSESLIYRIKAGSGKARIFPPSRRGKEERGSIRYICTVLP
jgi:hypothetical protein